MKYTEGSILYFDPFYFKNGNTAKKKYFLVLKDIDDVSILASLPTSRDTIPADKVIENGCIELPDINLNCYVVSANTEVTKCGKMFPVPTFIYGHQIDEYQKSLMEDIYPLEGTDYFVWGEMKIEIFSELIKCLKASKSVKRKYKRSLGFS